MAEIRKTVCDVCGAEHQTDDRVNENITAGATDGTWLVLCLEVFSSYGGMGSDGVLGTVNMGVCNRESCISTALARCYERAASTAVSTMDSMRAARAKAHEQAISNRPIRSAS